ncbi:MAG: PEP/pyruvate-binding domain-containing protein, partial [Candidatus Omnitrophota bacterium]
EMEERAPKGGEKDETTGLSEDETSALFDASDDLRRTGLGRFFKKAARAVRGYIKKLPFSSKLMFFVSVGALIAELIIFKTANSVVMLALVPALGVGDTSGADGDDPELDITDIGTAGTHNMDYQDNHVRMRIQNDIEGKRFVKLTRRNGDFVIRQNAIGENASPLDNALRSRIIELNKNKRLADFLAEREKDIRNLTVFLLEPHSTLKSSFHPHMLSVMGKQFSFAWSGTHGGRQQSVYMTRAFLTDMDMRLIVDILINQIELAIARHAAWHEDGSALVFGDINSKKVQNILRRLWLKSVINDELKAVQVYEMRISKDYAIDKTMCEMVVTMMGKIRDKMPRFTPVVTGYERAVRFKEAVEEYDFDEAVECWGELMYEFRELRSRTDSKARQLFDMPETTMFLACAGGINEVFESYIAKYGMYNRGGQRAGRVVGTVRVIDDINKIDEAFAAAKGDEIWVIPYLQNLRPEIPGVGCIISVGGNNHAVASSREQGIPVAIIPNAAELLRNFDLQRGMLRVGPIRYVRVRMAFEGETGEPLVGEKITVKVPKARIDGKLIYRLKDVDENFVTFVGSKAANLGNMINFGIKVPEGIDLSFAFWARFAADNGLDGKVAELRKKIKTEDGKILSDTAELEAVLAEIKQVIMDGEFSEELKSALFPYINEMRRKYGRVGFYVRSSFPFEDLTEKSTAGRYDSYPSGDFTDTSTDENLLEAIKMVFASKWNEIAFRERVANDVSDETNSPSVVIQVPVKARYAGTMYTADTVTDDLNKIVMAAVHGQGAAAVSEAGKPAEVIVDKTLTVKEGTEVVQARSLVDVEYRFTDGSLEEGYVTPEERHEEILTPPRVKELKTEGERIEGLSDYRPRDIEWVMGRVLEGEEDEFWYVQTRPMVIPGLPTMQEKIFDDITLDRLAVIDEDALNRLMQARHDPASRKSVDILLEKLHMDMSVSKFEQEENHRMYAERIVAARYLSPMAKNRDFTDRITLDDARAVMKMLKDNNTIIKDFITTPKLLSFLREVGLGSADPGVRREVRSFFVDYLGSMDILFHLTAIEIAIALAAYGEYEMAVTKLRDAKLAGAFPDVADRMIRVLSEIPTESSIAKLETYVTSEKTTDGIKEFAERVIDRLRKQMEKYPVTVGIRAEVYDRLETAGDLGSIRDVDGVADIVKVGGASRAAMMEDLDLKTRAVKGISVFLDIDDPAIDVDEMVEVVSDFVDKTQKDITRLMNPEVSRLTEENVRRIQDMDELRRISGVLVRLFANAESFELSEKSIYDIRIHNISEKYRTDYTDTAKEYMENLRTKKIGRENRRCMVTAVDNAADLRLLAEAIRDRREAMEVTDEASDPVKDVVLVRNDDIKANIDWYLEATGLGEYLSADRIIFVNESEAMTPTDVLEAVRETLGGEVTAGEVAIGTKGDIVDAASSEAMAALEAGKEDSMLLVRMSSDGLVSQLYKMTLEIAANGDRTPSAAVDGKLTQAKQQYNLFIYVPRVERVDMEELQRYEARLREVLIRA